MPMTGRVESSTASCASQAASPSLPMGVSPTEHELRAALVQRELSVVFQPQVSMVTGMMTGAETLLRWCRGGDEVMSPEIFVQVAEMSGLIDDLGDLVLDQACAFAAELRRTWLPDARIAVNISARQCGDTRIVARVEAALSRWDLPAQALELEITEGAFDGELGAVGETLGLLAEKGIQLAIDDFGAGSSNLVRLSQFRVDRIKLDCALVHEINRHRTKQAIARAMVFLAGELGYELTAEGVETEEQWHCLAEIGCHQAQGFGIARPLTAAHLLARRSGTFLPWPGVPMVASSAAPAVRMRSNALRYPAPRR